MKTTSTSKAAFFNPRVLIGFALCLVGVFLGLAGLSNSVTGTIVTTPDSTEWYVDGVNGSDNNDCKSPTTACKTIGHAISLAASGDSIKVAAATYTENLTIRVNLKITGASASATIIDGGGGAREVIVIPSGVQVTLSKITIQNGLRGIDNAGILTVTNSNISRNTNSTWPFAFGGGVFNSGTLTITNSTLNDNTAVRPSFPVGGYVEGGGIYNTGTLTINNSTLSGNTASVPSPGNGSASGGGIFNGGTLTINNSTLNGNYAYSYGGSAVGGGIWGGALISNSTLSDNSARDGGGGIYTAGSVILQNSIVANSPSGGNCSGTITSNGYNLSSDGTCAFNNTGDLNNTNPSLGPLQDNGGPTQTQALLTGSPAIDAGNPGGCTDGQGRLLKKDQRGMPRPDHEDTSGCDMGAYESQSD